jgi:hypothetical protein
MLQTGNGIIFFMEAATAIYELADIECFPKLTSESKTLIRYAARNRFQEPSLELSSQAT